MAVGNLITRAGYAVSGEANTAWFITHGLGDFGGNTPTPPPQGSILIHHKRRGQAGSVMRGTGLAGGGGLIQ